MAYSPAFQFYPADYLGDKNTIPMSTVEHGAYDLLWMHCWQQDGLPDDMEELADMAKLSVEQFEPMWKRRIKKCFVFDEKKKKYFHPRLLKEIKKQKSWKKEKSEAGKLGAAKRWKQKDKPYGTAIAPPYDRIADDGSSSLSLFPFSSLFSSLDLKRLIDCVRAKHPRRDARLVEIAVIQTLINRNGSEAPINSAEYFTSEVRHMCSKSNGIGAGTVDVVLRKRREQIAKVVKS